MEDLEHRVKIWPEYYDDIESGAKPVDLRIDDRGYQAGHFITFQEYNPRLMSYTNRETTKKIKHVMKPMELGAEIRTLLGINPSPAKMGNLVILSLCLPHEN